MTANGNPALVLCLDGGVDGVPTTRAEDGRVTRLYYVRNTEKLARAESETCLASRRRPRGPGPLRTAPGRALAGRANAAGPSPCGDGPAACGRPGVPAGGQTFSATRSSAGAAAGAGACRPSAGTSGATFSSASMVLVKPNQYVATKPAT
ncbi:hypothetical protein LRR80_06409 [Streptomyces sp. RO-S4]|nr:hypothetical protein [Streptomyces sp. RO-S4]